jgi:hypothetical protein
VLKVYTTHLKQGWHRRNGVPMSARATMTEYFFRHGNVLTQMTITEDPVFLDRAARQDDEPAAERQRHANQYQAWLFCQADDEVPGAIPRTCRTSCRGRTLPDRVRREAPPAGRTDRGGAETAYPEYAKTMKAPAERPARDAARLSRPGGHVVSGARRAAPWRACRCPRRRTAG